MPKMVWLDSHVGSIEAGIEKINQFYWNISIEKVDDSWIVLGGEKILLVAETREEVDCFLYGMGLAYSIMPEAFIKKFREEFEP